MKKRFWKRAFCLSLGAIMAVGNFIPGMAVTASAAESWPSGPSVASPNAIVMEASTGTVLYEKNANEKHYPASITKIMTTLLALENSSMDDVVTFSSDSVYKTGGSGIARDVGEKLTMEQCLYAAMLESANECAYAVAEHVGGGNYRKFINMMNEKAATLGCKNTHFDNCNGLPDTKHYTTCYDMALIAKAAIQNEEFRKIVGTVTYTIPKTNKHKHSLVMYNHHKMICANRTNQYLYDYCIGGKTGYTVAAGNTLVTYAEKDGMLLVCVIMNSNSVNTYKDTRKLFNYCFSNFHMLNVSEHETGYSSNSVSGNELFKAAGSFAKLDQKAKIILPAGVPFSAAKKEISYDDVGNGVLGTLDYKYDGRYVGEAQLLATGATAETYPFTKTIGSTKSVSKSDSASKSGTEQDNGKIKVWEIAVPVVIIVIAAVILFLFKKPRKRKRRKKKDRVFKTIQNNKRWNPRGKK